MSAIASNPFMNRLKENRGMIFPLGFIGLLGVVLVPLPTWCLDLLLVSNITLSIIVLVTTIYVKSPLEFAVFPSLLLAITLFRLVLNVATTRLILMRIKRVVATFSTRRKSVIASSNDGNTANSSGLFT